MNPNNPRYIYDKANWAAFALNATITPAMIEGNIDKAVAAVTNTIIKAAVLQSQRPQVMLGNIPDHDGMKNTNLLKNNNRKHGEIFLKISHNNKLHNIQTGENICPKNP